MGGTWGLFGALLLFLISIQVVWCMRHKWQPLQTKLLEHTKLSKVVKMIPLCGKVIPLLGLALYLDDLISDIQVARAVWQLGNWYGKAVLGVIIGHYTVRGCILSLHVTRHFGRQLQRDCDFRIGLLINPRRACDLCNAIFGCALFARVSASNIWHN